MTDGARCAAHPLSRVPVLAGALAVVVLVAGGQVRPHAEQGPPAGGIALHSTAHDPVPAELAGYWLTPASPTAISLALRDFARAVQVIEAGGDPASVAPLMASPSLEKTPLVDYVRYYRGVAALRAARLDEAVEALTPVVSATPSYITELAALRLAEAYEQQGRYADAAGAYGRALAGRPAEPDRVAHKWGIALERAGDLAGAIAAHRRVYYDYPLSPDAVESGEVLARLNAFDAPFEGQLALERARADALYAARRCRPPGPRTSALPKWRPAPIANRPQSAWPRPTCS